MTSPVSMPAGHEIVAADLDAYENLTGAWTSFTPTWTASVNPAIGNGTITGRYIQVGKLVIYSCRIVMGSTTTFGTGTWLVSLPVTAASSQHGSTGGAWAFDSSTGLGWAFAVTLTNTTNVVLPTVAGGFVSPTSPITWATSDRLDWQIIYQAA